MGITLASRKVMQMLNSQVLNLQMGVEPKKMVHQNG